MADNSFAFEQNSMATYAEQIVAIKKTGGAVAAVFGIWLLALVLIILLLLFNIPLNLLLCFGVAYGAFWLTCRFNVEYEYIITNGIVDIDKIVNKSNRKRVMTFDLRNTTRLEKYNPAAIIGINQKEILFACNKDANSYFISVDKPSGGSVNLVFAPNEKLQKEICKTAPRFLTNNVFK
ncbi:MAG: hypothetical protein IJO62_03960 [Clostridia bacterium]|nr:hypothetical protein [Clostridia bacterium]